MSKAPAFQWYPKDILASARVQMMSLTEECAYRRLIDFCWLNGSIPSDASRAARLVGKGCSVEVVKVALEMFIPHQTDADKLIHERLEEERLKQAENSKKRSAASAARWQKQGKSADERGKQADTDNIDANAMQTQSEGNANDDSKSGLNERQTADESKNQANKKPISLNNGGNNPNDKQTESNSNANAMQMDSTSFATSTSSQVFSDEKTLKKNGGGGIEQKPPTADFSMINGKPETLKEYLLRKQLEFPQHDVQKVYADFKSKCGSVQYPKLKNTQRHFDKWISEQDLELPEETKISGDEQIKAALAKKYGDKK